MAGFRGYLGVIFVVRPASAPSPPPAIFIAQLNLRIVIPLKRRRFGYDQPVSSASTLLALFFIVSLQRLYLFNSLFVLAYLTSADDCLARARTRHHKKGSSTTGEWPWLPASSLRWLRIANFSSKRKKAIV